MAVRSADARVTTKEVPQRRLNFQVLLAVVGVAGTLAVLARLPDPEQILLSELGSPGWRPLQISQIWKRTPNSR